MNALERKHLRDRAAHNWEDAKRLRLEAAVLQTKTLETRHRAGEKHAHAESLIERAGELKSRSSEIRDRSQELSEDARYFSGEAKMVLARASGSTFFEDLVDRAIDLRSDVFEDDEVDGNVALVASGEIEKLARMKQLVGTLVPHTLGVVDAGTALGAVIATQPDLAIVDSKLEIADGVDMTLSFPLFAPRTKALVLTDDPQRAADLRIVGFDAGPRAISDSQLLVWTANALAEAAS